MLIRTAQAEDLDGIFAIYDREVLSGISTFETIVKPEEARSAWLEGHAPERYPVAVATDGAILGWGSLSAWSERCAYARAAEVSVYVHHDHRGKGIGSALLADLIRRAGTIGYSVLLARIAQPNPASDHIHKRAGFRTIGVMRRVGEKFGRVLDVRLMDLHLDGTGAE